MHKIPDLPNINKYPDVSYEEDPKKGLRIFNWLASLCNITSMKLINLFSVTTKIISEKSTITININSAAGYKEENESLAGAIFKAGGKPSESKYSNTHLKMEVETLEHTGAHSLLASLKSSGPPDIAVQYCEFILGCTIFCKNNSLSTNRMHCLFSGYMKDFEKNNNIILPTDIKNEVIKFCGTPNHK